MLPSKGLGFVNVSFTYRGKLAVEIVYMGLFWVESTSNTYLKDRTTLDVLPRDRVGSVNVSLPSILDICDSPWESREKGERTGTRAMTRHTKRVTSLSDMRICNKQNKECHGRYCFACSSFCPKQ